MVNFQEALDWLTTSLSFGINPGLERVQWLLEQLGNPQHELAAIHVVGTNGKGSTVNYLRHIFQEAGYDVGTFTSPSIMDFRERIAVNGQMISKSDLVAAVNVLKPVVERLEQETDFGPATEFELITLIMFIYFARLRPVDLVVIEAGLGGRYDSTNVFTPLAVICTSIGLDHQNFLGQTHLAIAGEKIGVLKPSVPLIFSEKRPDVRQLFYQTAQELESPTYEKGVDFDLVTDQDGLTFRHAGRELTSLNLAMPGHHQVSNASLALMATQLLRDKYPKVTDEGISVALSQSYWAGRTEFLTPQLMIDGAHNDESIAVLVDVLRQDYADRKIHLLFAALDTKPVTSMLEKLQVFEDVSVTTFDYPNACQLQAYPEVFPRVASFEKWLTQLNQADPEELFVITGSLYFIGQVRRYFLATQGSSNP